MLVLEHTFLGSTTEGCFFITPPKDTQKRIFKTTSEGRGKLVETRQILEGRLMTLCFYYNKVFI